MTTIIVQSGKKCRFWHSWFLYKAYGETIYYKCHKCESRKAEQSDGIYQPVDWDFLKEGNSDLYL